MAEMFLWVHTVTFANIVLSPFFQSRQNCVSSHRFSNSGRFPEKLILQVVRGHAILSRQKRF
jgi:hypothetical protein